MATFSAVTPTGWTQGDDASDASGVVPSGWEQISATAGGDGEEALSGSAISGAHGTAAPVFTIPL